ncbi:hypothetical protein HGA91_05075 [candidate division WWE3 bacterium]|nr:hypothetical protein [candidate division WWE3 bacterium]
MAKPAFSIARIDERIKTLWPSASPTVAAQWAIDCTVRVLPFFEQEYPNDTRPRQALAALTQWMNTGVFKMAVIRTASLDSHAAAREVGNDTPARSAARSAGQTCATAHVKDHAIAAAMYAQQALFRSALPELSLDLVASEREWQYEHLCELIRVSPADAVSTDK